MRVEIWEKDQKEEEQPLRLRLVRSDFSDRILLQAVDKSGEAISMGGLLMIGKDGRATRCSNINPSLGLKLNGIGELKC